MGTRSSKSCEKRPEDETDRSTPCSVEAKKALSFTYIPRVRFHGMVLGSIGNFYHTFITKNKGQSIMQQAIQRVLTKWIF
jgi:hypothetical protein